jgi:hypothetical protein
MAQPGVLRNSLFSTGPPPDYCAHCFCSGGTRPAVWRVQLTASRTGSVNHKTRCAQISLRWPLGKVCRSQKYELRKTFSEIEK